MKTGWNATTLVVWLCVSGLVPAASIAGVVRRGWHWHHALTAVAAGVCMVGAALGLRNPLASMASYSAALMVLNQWVPPLLLMSVPAARWTRWRGTAAPMPALSLAGWLLDPWVAMTVFTTFSVMVSLPGIFEPALANALFAAPLGLLELISGLLFWAHLSRSLRTFRHDWQSGLYALVGSLPMMAVATVWMLSAHVLYMPYVDVVCQWNISPLADQHWAGFVMLAMGLPLQIAGAWRLAQLGAHVL
ncbi:cytochrome c oxidase assembly protein [Paraburkholderia nodosa]|uniref:cytochrome c oxidase assembly protein n=1 Tax=Paraburkholderia nodosa TaxID=392320 RepID=UPI0004AE9429|nr:cytochrome c oxidase assembly protein [Paraburkholderia nodosa]